ncbi:hypothetical protein TWF694_007882 [Orbilia ellipsospora]|uniref:Uncharacterized protein n=1 Tax=Orbilia ellipsospora TaxID=2528407 RepID=A0AAV9XK08_9PEZI
MLFRVIFISSLLVRTFGFPTNAKPIAGLGSISPEYPTQRGVPEGIWIKEAPSTQISGRISSSTSEFMESSIRTDLSNVQKRGIEDAMAKAVDMVPIREETLIPPHLQKRGDIPSKFELKQNITLMYGGDVVKNQIYLANMTLYAPDPDHPLIMMENFDDLASHIECGLSQKKISVIFKSKLAMDHAIKAWKWVNSGEVDYFYLIANHASCCPTSQRTPYKITGLKMDQTALATELTVEPIEWKQVAGNFELNIGRRNVSQHSKRHFDTSILSKRFFGLDSLAIKLINFLGIAPDIKYMNSIFVDLTLGKGRWNLLADPFHEFKYLEVNCIDCYVTGGVELGVHIKVENSTVQNLGIYAQPRGLNARMEVEYIVQHPLPKPLSFLHSLTPDIPLNGFSIPYIFTFGPSVQINAGVDLKFQGVGNFSSGLDVKVPDSAIIIADAVAGKSGVSGFSNPILNPVLRVNELSARAEAGAFIGPSIAFGAKVLDMVRYEGAIEFKLPYLAASLETGSKSEGICSRSKSNKTVTTGVSGQLSANLEVWFKLGSPTEPIPIPGWVPNIDRKLWGRRHEFAPICLPLEIPGLGLNPIPDSVVKVSSVFLNSTASTNATKLVSLAAETGSISVSRSMPTPFVE